jgi:TPR repeat protein
MQSLHHKMVAKASRGDANAQYWLAEAYATGEGAKADPKRALEYYGKAAAQSHPGALYELGFVHVKGEGVKPDWRKAIKYFERAAAAGSSDAAILLGDAFREGKLNIRKGPGKAAFYYCVALRLGDSRGARALALMLRTPSGLSKGALRSALLAATRSAG